jgi:ferredoxin
MMDMGYLNARWVLGWALVKHVLMTPFARREPADWVQTIADEALGATPPGAWAKQEAASRCIGCGLCAAVVPAHVQPAEWIMGIGRQPSDAPLALQQAHLLRQFAVDIERICPARVKVTDVADLIEAHAAALNHNPLRGGSDVRGRG